MQCNATSLLSRSSIETWCLPQAKTPKCTEPQIRQPQPIGCEPQTHKPPYCLNPNYTLGGKVNSKTLILKAWIRGRNG